MSETIVLGPHGRRWAVWIGADEMPYAEYENRHEAESAAALIADRRGGSVRVVERDASGLAASEDPSSEGIGGEGGAPVRGPRGGHGAPADELPRETQQGL